MQWDATFRSRSYLNWPEATGDPEVDATARMLTRMSANFAARHEEIPLEWRDHVFVRVGQPTGIIDSILKRSCEATFLRLLDKITAEGRRVTDSPNSPNFAPNIFGRRPPSERDRFSQGDFRRRWKRSSRQAKSGLSRIPRPTEPPELWQFGRTEVPKQVIEIIRTWVTKNEDVGVPSKTMILRRFSRTCRCP